MPDMEQEKDDLLRRLSVLDAERRSIAVRLQELDRLQKEQAQPHTETVRGSEHFSPAEKIAVFRRLFRGRQDVYPRRFESRKTGKSGYQPVCANEWRRGICSKPGTKCSACEYREWMPLSDAVIEKHLRGADERGNDFTIGVYPMLESDLCCFLAVDFDEKDFRNDVAAFLVTCRKHQVPASLERSRSGNGAHIWIFFSEPVSAHTARQMGCFLLTETMDSRPELGFESYDRFFPNQDTMPSGGLGNLIALPLQAKPRRNGNSVFLNDDFNPHPDQWAYLASVKTMSASLVEALAARAVETGRVTAVKMPVLDEGEVPWEQPPSRKKATHDLNAGLTAPLNIVIENEIYFTKSQLPAKLQTALLRLAAFQNPEFYSAQAMRMPTYDKPRIICCAEDFPEHIGLPRGCADDIANLLIDNKIRYTVSDKRNRGVRQTFSFHGTLRPEQQKAADALLKNDLGVLSASTAFGKTIVAIYLLAKRSTGTLILVHRVQLITQWKARLQTFLGIDPKTIGVIGAGKRKPTGIIDIASIQSLVKKGVVDDLVGGYGMVIADECHHLSAFSFESVIRQCKCQYVLGLSATLTRKDGHHPVIFMQCGPVRYRVSDKQQASERPFDHRVMVRETPLVLPSELASKEKPSIHEIYDLIVHDDERNQMIAADIRAVLAAGRNPVVITERKEHLVWFERKFGGIRNVFVMRGGMRRKALVQLQKEFGTVLESEPRLLLATGKFLGEGFDDPRLDTLFLTMPISWRGTLSQYAGRLHRLYDRKTEVVIYDYADLKIGMTSRMFARRLSGYRAIGYRISERDELPFDSSERTISSF